MPCAWVDEAGQGMLTVMAAKASHRLSPRWGLLGLLCSVALACSAPSAMASSIVYSKDGELWIMRADGSGQRAIPNTRGLSEPSQADDGTILALDGGGVVRIGQTGVNLSPPVTTPVGLSSAPAGPFSGWSDLHGPADPVISPDDTHFAYWGFGQTDRYDFSCDCFELSLENFVRYGNPRVFDEPETQGYGQGDAAYPGWIGNNELMIEPIGNDGLTQLVWVYVVGQGQNAETEWFTDPGFNGDAVTGMKEGVMSRRQDKLAFVVDYRSQSGQTTNRLILYTTTGGPPAAPVQRCGFSNPPGGRFAYPSFSPDGNSLAFADGNGIEIANVADLADCSTVRSRVVAPGGDHPSWGAADEQQLQTSPCAGKSGREFKRCRANVSYQVALQRCARMRSRRRQHQCRTAAARRRRNALRGIH